MNCIFVVGIPLSKRHYVVPVETVIGLAEWRGGWDWFKKEAKWVKLDYWAKASLEISL